MALPHHNSPLSVSFSHTTLSLLNSNFASAKPILCMFGANLHMPMGGGATDAQFHVLAVDDSFIDRKLIERLLKTSSYHVTAVDSGNKALEFLGLQEDEERVAMPPSVSPNHHGQEVEVSLIITDYCMPGMTGYDLLRKIKESTSLKDIPVVIMSSENVPSRINRCLEGGAEEFFLKPVQLSDVKKLRPHITREKTKGQHSYTNNRNGMDGDISLDITTRAR